MNGTHRPRELLLEPGYLPSRRGLLAGATALGLPLLLPRLASAGRSRSEPRTLKVGLIGCGGRGTGAAWQAVHAEEGTVVLSAMGDLFADRLASSYAHLEAGLDEEGHRARLDVPEERRFVGFDAFRRVIDSGVDIAILAAIPAFRPAHLDYAIDKGCHVFCEKPMAVDVPGVRRIEAAAERAREKALSIASGFCWRYSARHREFFERVHAGALGAVQTVHTNYYSGQLPTRARQPGWSDVEWMLRNWQHFRWLGGDHLLEQSIHSIDKQSWAFGDRAPLRAVATGGCQTRSGPEKGDTYDHFAIVYEYEDGARAFANARQWPAAYGENNDYLWGTRGRGVIENWTPLHRIAPWEGEPWEYTGEGNDMYQQQLDDLVASIRSGAPINDGPWMARSNLVALLGREAAYSGRALTFDELIHSERRLGPRSLDDGLLDLGELAQDRDPVPGEYRFL